LDQVERLDVDGGAVVEDVGPSLFIDDSIPAFGGNGIFIASAFNSSPVLASFTRLIQSVSLDSIEPPPKVDDAGLCRVIAPTVDYLSLLPFDLSISIRFAVIAINQHLIRRRITPPRAMQSLLQRTSPTT
jgi:hypothetical protein